MILSTLVVAARPVAVLPAATRRAVSGALGVIKSDEIQHNDMNE
jgi:hypothetical protein